VIESFRDEWVADIFHGRDTKLARKNLPQELHAKAKLKLQLINNAGNINDLRVPPGNKLHQLQGQRADEHAIWINAQWRIVFRHQDPDKFKDVGIEDYH
jgi:proteic killer suppression protein